jgi:lipoprotein-anchoring transpeptidase ErfK/SrfK
MRRGIAFALAGAGLATAAAAAWTASTIVLRPSVEQPVHVVRAPKPAGDRIFLSEAQLIQAKATGVLDRDVKSIINVRKRMTYGDFVWNDRTVPNGPVWVRVDLNKQILSVYRAGHEIGTAVILYGVDEKETPVGTFPVLAKSKDYRSRTYDNAPMPFSLHLTRDGVAIHGSDVRWGRATHGCVGVPVEFAERMFGQVSKGDEVVIVSRDRTA